MLSKSAAIFHYSTKFRLAFPKLLQNEILAALTCSKINVNLLQAAPKCSFAPKMAPK